MSLKDKSAWLKAILAIRGLSDRAKVVAATLFSFHNVETGRCDPRQETLASAAGLSRNAVVKAIRELRELGWIATSSIAGKQMAYRLMTGSNANGKAGGHADRRVKTKPDAGLNTSPDLDVTYTTDGAAPARPVVQLPASPVVHITEEGEQRLEQGNLYDKGRHIPTDGAPEDEAWNQERLDAFASLIADANAIQPETEPKEETAHKQTAAAEPLEDMEVIGRLRIPAAEWQDMVADYPVNPRRMLRNREKWIVAQTGKVASGKQQAEMVRLCWQALKDETEKAAREAREHAVKMAEASARGVKMAELDASKPKQRSRI